MMALNAVRGFFTHLCRWGAGIAAVVAWGGFGAVAATTPIALPADAGFVAVAGVPPAARPGAKVRTTGRIELLLAQNLAGGPEAHLIEASDPLQAMHAGSGAGVWLGVWPAHTPVPDGVVRQSFAYPVGPMAIMRSDTNIRDWKALAQRTVCVVEGGPYVGEIAERFGAIEQRYPSATDVLLAVRAGQCDAGVLNDRLLDALQKFPEWKKFSARLPAYRQADLVWVSSAAGADAVWNSRMREISSAKLAAMTAQQARDIAFEVYLDQIVPDCH